MADDDSARGATSTAKASGAQLSACSSAKDIAQMEGGAARCIQNKGSSLPRGCTWLISLARYRAGAPWPDVSSSLLRQVNAW